VALLAPSSSRADVILAQSQFASGTEGWLLGDFYQPLFLDVSGALFWQATGGNPGGFIGASRDALAPSSVEGFFAPAAFLGDKSAAFGGSLLFSMEALLGNDGVNFPMLAISDGSLFLQFRTSLPGLSWTDYTIPLRAGAGWEVSANRILNDGTPGAPATDAQILQVLSHLSFMSIREDVRGGDDQTNLDGVVLTAPTATTTPEPSTFVLLASGLAAVGFVSKRKRLSLRT